MVDVAAQNPLCAAFSTKSDRNAYLTAMCAAFVSRMAYAKAVPKVDPELEQGRSSSKICEGDGDVVGVVTPLRGGAQVLHGIQVVEVGVRLRVHQDGEVEEDGEGQVEVEREEGEVKERRSWMACGWDEDSRTS